MPELLLWILAWKSAWDSAWNLAWTSAWNSAWNLGLGLSLKLGLELVLGLGLDLGLELGLELDALHQGVSDLHVGAEVQGRTGVHGRAGLQGAGWHGEGGVNGGLISGQAGHCSPGLVPQAPAVLRGGPACFAAALTVLRGVEAAAAEGPCAGHD